MPIDLTEFYPEYQGRPESKVALDMETRNPSIPPGLISGVLLSASYSTVELTNNYTAADYTAILVSTGGSGVTITLPPATANAGRFYIIKKIDSTGGVVTVKGDTAAETIDGEIKIRLGLQYQFIQPLSDGNVWHVIGGRSVTLEELLDNKLSELINLSSDNISELRQIKAHQASLSNAHIDADEVQEE